MVVRMDRPRKAAAPSSVGLSEQDLIQSICKESLFETLKEFWEEIITESPVWNWHIQFLCDELERIGKRVLERKPKEYDLIINIPPGTTKSTVCSVVFPIWLWMNDPTIQTICGSFSGDLAVDLGSKSRDIVYSEKFQSSFPDVQIRDDIAAKRFFKNKAGGWRKATGTGAMITGFHGHVIIIDDPLDPNSAYSEPELETANKWMTDVIPKRKVDKAITPTILIMQRLSEDDPTGHWLERIRGKKSARVKHICLPAEETEKIKPASVIPFYKENGGLLDPIRLNPESLEESRNEGVITFSSQFLQDPYPPGASMFQTEQIEILRVDAMAIRKNMKMMRRYWDKAGTEGDGAFTAGGLMGVHAKSGDFWILDMVRGQWGTHRRENTIKQTAHLDGSGIRIGIEQEPGSGGKESAENTIRNLAGFRVKAFAVGQSEGNKIQRADPFSVQVNAGNVKMVAGDWNNDLIRELRLFPRWKFKDQVDSLGGAFNMLTKGKIRVGGFKGAKR